MKAIIYNHPGPYSEEQEPEKPDPRANRNRAHTSLIKQAFFRDQVQSAIYELIRGYEAATGLSVIRLDYRPEMHRVTLDDVPFPR